MDYKILKMKFPWGVHFGNTNLTDTAYTIHADTLFSALCIEALKVGQAHLNQLIHYVKMDQLRISDTFPYVEKTYYLPKPCMQIETEANKGNSVDKKQMKKIAYVPVEQMDYFVKGTFRPEACPNLLLDFGTSHVRTVASVRGEEETKPYRIGIYTYGSRQHADQEQGLYVIIGYESEEAYVFLLDLFMMLSYTGIGGKRSWGYGRYETKVAKLPEYLERHLYAEGKLYMTLSVSLPKEDELERALSGAQYQMVKRSGFVDSSTYATSQMRKRDLYVFAAGSCFEVCFRGDVYDVATLPTHPVYRYAKPIFLQIQ